MITLKRDPIYLRALEPKDLNFLYELENDESVWEVSNTASPYSKFVLKQYLDNAHKDIYEVKQLRLVICTSEGDAVVGFIDLFEFDPKHDRVGLGIIIFSEEDRHQGYATAAVEAVCDYAREHLKVHQLFANIAEDNLASIQLFEKLGFVRSGLKKDWVHSGGSYKNELFYQYFHEES
ncbi:MAG: GNAT family N-acetyltransferase [Bacteroidia bacterium]|nr:GNAT family N-acetyltransferase [Bacteroidia bacterium]NNM23307.1 GNAT family N-acetyltransferase [Flavobacteriaceae bacterium]